MKTSDELLRESLIRQCNPSPTNNTWLNWAAAEGALLIGLGLASGARRGCVPLSLGAALLASWACENRSSSTACDQLQSQDEPDTSMSRNQLDQASWESFPASDPPAYSAS